MGIQASFLRQPEKLSGVLVDCDLDLHDTENPDLLHALVARFIDPPTVTSPTPPYPPVCDFIGTPLTGLAPLTVHFTDLTLNNPTLWRWYFEPEWFPVEEQNPVHVFENPGTYAVGLYVSNDYGEHAAGKDDYIVATALPPPPPANLFLNPGFETGFLPPWGLGIYGGGQWGEIGTAYKRTGSYGVMMESNHDINPPYGIVNLGQPLFGQPLWGVRVDSVEFYYTVKNVPPEGGSLELLIFTLFADLHWTAQYYPIPSGLCDWTLFHQDGPWIGVPGVSIIWPKVLVHGAGHYYSDKFRVWVDDFFAPPHV